MVYPAVFRHVLFPAYETLIGRGTHRYLAEYRRDQWLKPPALAQVQLDKLNNLLDWCWQEVPYLQGCWRRAGLRPRRLTNVKQLEDFPIITKQEITANYGDMTALSLRGHTLQKTTGGTTGDPFRFEYTMESYARRTAVMWRGYEWAGAGLGVRTAYLWGAPLSRSFGGRLKDRFFHAAFNRKLFDVTTMLKEGDIRDYALAIGRYQPDVLVGFVRSVLAMARWMKATGHQLHGLKSVILGAEPVYAAERKEIEEAFGCAAFNTYGAREFMLIAAECERRTHLHVNADHLVVELLDSGGCGAAEGAAGDVVVTDLHNLAMPLVRYRNGDRATAAGDRPCSCGRGLPMLQSIDGRVLDMIVTPDGRHVPGEFFINVMLGRTAIRQYQVLQVDVDSLEVRIVSSEPLAMQERQAILDMIGKVTGPEMRICVKDVDAISAPPSGKRRVTVSLESFRAQSLPG